MLYTLNLFSSPIRIELAQNTHFALRDHSWLVAAHKAISFKFPSSSPKSRDALFGALLRALSALPSQERENLVPASSSLPCLSELRGLPDDRCNCTAPAPQLNTRAILLGVLRTQDCFLALEDESATIPIEICSPKHDPQPEPKLLDSFVLVIRWRYIKPAWTPNQTDNYTERRYSPYIETCVC